MDKNSKQNGEDRESRVKKRKREDEGSATPNQDPRAKREKRTENDDDSTFLNMYLHTPAEESQPPFLPESGSITLKGGDRRTMPVTICGQTVIALVDSGTDFAIITTQAAEELGLLEMPNAVKTYSNFCTWEGIKGVEMYELKDLEITLQNQATLITDVSVLPEEYNFKSSVKYSLILGVTDLYSYGAVERFSENPEMRSLHFKQYNWQDQTSRSLKKIRNPKVGALRIKTHLRADKQDPKLNLDLDTGVRCSYGSIPQNGPRTLRLALTQDYKVTETIANEKAPACDFIIGTKFLNRYEAVIDYSAQDLYLRQNGKPWMRLKLVRVLKRVQ